MSEAENNAPQQEAPYFPVQVHAQYLKDLSFESPNVPESLKRATSSPEIEMDMNLDAQKIEDDKLEHLYEVTMRVNVSAKREDQTLFIVEVIYATLLSFEEKLAANIINPILFIEIPRVMFPFARQAVANASQLGGFPPLMLNMIDFKRMYIQQHGHDPDNPDAENTHTHGSGSSH